MRMKDKLRQLRNSSVFITGAGGFIGRHLVKKISALGAKVHLLLKQPPNPAELKAWKKEWGGKASLSFYYADISDRKRISKIVRRVRPERIFHLAGSSPSSEKSGIRECMETNILGTLNLLESAAKQDLRSFVFASTTELYGRNPLPFKEQQKIQPASPYALSKACGEYCCQFFLKCSGVPTIILRISPVYGPTLKEDRFLMKVFLSAMNPTEQELKLTSPSDRRDFIYIEDVVNALLLSSLIPKATGQIINVGNPTAPSLQEIIRFISSLTGKEPRVRWGAVPPSPLLQDHQQSDIRKAKKILGWKPAISMREGLKKMYHWLQSRGI